MITLLKLLVGVLYFLAVFLGVPCGIVGTGMLLTHFLGTAWWTGLIIGPVGLVEFVAAFCFIFWEDNPIPYWLTS